MYNSTKERPGEWELASRCSDASYGIETTASHGAKRDGSMGTSLLLHEWVPRGSRRRLAAGEVSQRAAANERMEGSCAWVGIVLG